MTEPSSTGQMAPSGLKLRKRRSGILGLIAELWDFLKVRKKFWLLPIVIMLLLIAVIIFLGSVAPAFAPFVYTF